MVDDVLIVGAGPTGLVLALWLDAQGVRVRIIDKNTAPSEESRALAVHARTLELYRQLGLAEEVAHAGLQNPTMNLWAGGKHKARLALGVAGAQLTPYPFILTYPQDQHERLLTLRLEERGVRVERHTELLGFEEQGDHITARLRLHDGSETNHDARYLAGCDGARSMARRQIGASFEGGTYKQLFYVADVEVSGMASAGEAHIALDSSDFVALLPYARGGYRLIGVVRGEHAERAETLTFDDVSHVALEGLRAKIDKVNWFSTYNVHHRVTDRFRRGRVFLLGDAAHVHSPVGGQGMNTGIADAVNLAWKLAAVLHEKAPDALLDSYALERQAFAHQLVATTDRVFTFVTSEGKLANFVRTRIAPLLVNLAGKLDAPRELLFRTVSQTALNYRDSPLSCGTAGKVQGGDRLPWVATKSGDNYAPLRSIGWQAHVYGEPRAALTAWCAAHHLPLQVFAFEAAHHAAGLAQNAVYLLRPDTYVALADAAGTPAALSAYLADRGLSLEAAEG